MVYTVHLKFITVYFQVTLPHCIVELYSIIPLLPPQRVSLRQNNHGLHLLSTVIYQSLL